jgi:hypothetical protein
MLASSLCATQLKRCRLKEITSDFLARRRGQHNSELSPVRVIERSRIVPGLSIGTDPKKGHSAWPRRCEAREGFRTPLQTASIQLKLSVLTCSKRTLPDAQGDDKMRRKIAVVIYSAVLGLTMLSSHAIAQQKTAKACRDEWRANKAANQANGVTEKAYVDQCRGGSAPAQTTAAPPPAAPASTAAAPQTATGQKTAKACRDEWRANKAANQANGVTEKAYVDQCRGGTAPSQTTAAPSAPVPAPTAVAPQPTTGQKTAKACRDEWRANKAANQANGVTERAYVDQCRGGASPSQTTAAPPAPAAAPTAAPAAPAPAPTAAAPSAKSVPQPTSAARTAPTAATNSVGANEFSTEALAKAHCPTDTVVWANLTSKVYHFSDTRFYGNTKNGAYMCERDSTAEGMRAAKNETHP